MAKLNLGKIVGRSAYEEAVRQGYDDSEVEWLKTLTAYGIAKKNGFRGTEKEWLETLKGTTAYQSAQKGGYVGSESDFNEYIASLGDLSTILDSINGEVL